MPSLSTTMSSHNIHLADGAKIVATHSLALDTATLGIDSDGVSISLFIWGTPDHVWDGLDAIIEACVALKADVAGIAVEQVVAPPTLIVV